MAPDIRDAMELVDPPAPTSPLVLIPFVVAILVVVGFFWWRNRRREKNTSSDSPEARAHNRLGKISHADPRAFYTELHSIFVEYLGSRARLNASRCTTPELIVLMSRAHLMSAEWRTSAEAFLADCEEAKFSPSPPERAMDTAIAGCRSLINQLATAPLMEMGALL